jgi:hypothetical protein
VSKRRFTRDEDQTKYRITFAGVLAVRLMEFDYGGKHYSYHGRKLKNAVKRLTRQGGPIKANTAELVEWGEACYEWKESNGSLP